jgi:ribosomal-protein-alanine N-acetyltransferase
MTMAAAPRMAGHEVPWPAANLPVVDLPAHEDADPSRRWRPMLATDLDAVMLIEQAAYAFPWSRGNFVDSLAAGYPAWLLLAADAVGQAPLGYYVAMPGVDEVHLLNITVRPAEQGRGHARAMLVHLARSALARGAHTLWLEVRDSNARARQLYQTSGFETVGRRKGYYPNGRFQREDAIVMRWPPAAEGSAAP